MVRQPPHVCECDRCDEFWAREEERLELATPQGMVQAFHKKFGVPVGSRGMILSQERALLRARLIVEEAAEVVTALQTRDYVGLAKELSDIEYVTLGTAVEAGIDLDAVFEEVHRSNMTKTPAKDAGGKVQKGPDYEPPDLERVLRHG